MDVTTGFNKLLKEKAEIFNEYSFNNPIVMSHGTYLNTKRLGDILHKAICYFANNYKEYLDLMPLGDKVLHVLEICSKYPFRAGTFRTDFLIDKDNQIKIIEMTTRQPLNGYFISGFSDYLGKQKSKKLNLSGVIDVYSGFFNYLNMEIDNKKTICVIKGKERLGDFKVYSDIFINSGFQYHVIELEELSQKIHLLDNAFVIEELNHSEILQLPDDYIELLTKSSILNDFRNLFLIHDKRFFYMLTDERFLNNALNEAEIKILQSYTIPSYLYNLHPEKFQQAYYEKDNWIIKPTLLGKSENIFAGCITQDKIWKQVFDSGDIENFVLQPMLRQRNIEGFVGKEKRNNFVAGTLLYFNDQYFGPGIYRASSSIITNQGDDRKLAQVVINNENILSEMTYVI